VAQLISSLGGKAGLSLSNQLYRITPLDYTLETNPVVAPSLVFFMETFRGNHFSLQTDFAFACRGSSTTTRSITVDHLEADRVIVNEGEPATSRHRYLAISPMLRARTTRGRVEPYALFGPRLDMLLYYSTQSDYPLEEQNHLILGLSMGVGADFNLKRNKLFTEIQVQPDLSPVTSEEPLLIQNNSLVLTLGLRWNRVK
jgi:hypothetical protein